MKKWVKIDIDLKDTRKMCSDKKKLAEECVTCFSDIQQSVSDFLSTIEEKDTKQRQLTEEKDNKQRAKMSDEWVLFLTDAKETLSNVVKHTETEASERNTNSRWVLSIVLGVTFCLGVAFGVLWGKVSDMKYLKADRSEVLLKGEAKFIHDLDKAYNDATFIRADGAPIDSTTYNLHIKAAYSGALRGVK